jgi:spore germination protein YaaH
MLQFLTDKTVRSRAIKSSLDAVEAGGLHGLSFDIEGNWRFNKTLRAKHSAFLRDLAAAGQRRTPPISLRYPVFWDIYKDSAVDLVAVTAATEATVLMTYDYHWAGDGRAGPNAPLVNCNANCSGEAGGANVERTIHFAQSLSHSGSGGGDASPKFFLGIPWYGLEYPTVGPELYGLTNYSKGPKRNYQIGGAGPLDCGSECRAQKYGKMWDEETQTPWYRFQMDGQWQQGYYDDARSLSLKYELAAAGNVSGLFIWPLNGNSVSMTSWAWEALAASVGPRG